MFSFSLLTLEGSVCHVLSACQALRDEEKEEESSGGRSKNSPAAVKSSSCCYYLCCCYRYRITATPVAVIRCRCRRDHCDRHCQCHSSSYCYCCKYSGFCSDDYRTCLCIQYDICSCCLYCYILIELGLLLPLPCLVFETTEAGRPRSGLVTEMKEPMEFELLGTHRKGPGCK